MQNDIPEVPAAVRDAIANYDTPTGFKLVPPPENNASVLFKWGVRLEKIDEGDSPDRYGFVCLADASCRSTEVFIRLSKGMTSKGTLHLKNKHFVTGERSDLIASNKRSFYNEVEQYRASNLYRTNKPRLVGLLDALKVINNNIPFKQSEYHESRLQMELTTLPEMRNTLYAKKTKHYILELYTASKTEAVSRIKEALIPGFPTISLSSNFWTLPLLKIKFVGMRITFIRSAKRYSLLLGVRHFNPSFVERSINGLTPTYRRWIDAMLLDFGIKADNLHSSTSDAGTDVKHMMSEQLKLTWTWCIPHMTNAVTKRAFGITKNYLDSKNKDMTKFIQKCIRLIFVVKATEKFGSLFKECQQMFANDQTENCLKLIGFSQHRFMSIYKMLERILKVWEPLEKYFEIKTKRHLEENLPGPPPEEFPLAGLKADVVQILSLLHPISITNSLSQGNNSNMVHVLLSVYKIRKIVLDLDVALLDFRSTKNDPVYLPVAQLTSMVRNTRTMLKDAFHSSFFRRYTTKKVICKATYVPEMCMFWDPILKQLSAIEQTARTCNLQRGVQEPILTQNVQMVMERVRSNIKKLLLKSAKSLHDNTSGNVGAAPTVSLNSDLLDAYAEFSTITPSTRVQSTDEAIMDKVESEMENWQSDLLESWQCTAGTGECESIIEFWERQKEKYPILHRAAQAILAVPPSAAEIERDFGIAGNLVTKNRCNLKSEYIDMSLFCNRNRGLVSIDQVPEIAKADKKKYIPKNIAMDFDEPDDFFDTDLAMSSFFTSSTIE